MAKQIFDCHMMHLWGLSCPLLNHTHIKDTNTRSGQFFQTSSTFNTEYYNTIINHCRSFSTNHCFLNEWCNLNFSLAIFANIFKIRRFLIFSFFFLQGIALPNNIKFAKAHRCNISTRCFSKHLSMCDSKISKYLK